MNILMIGESYYPLNGGIGVVVRSISERIVNNGHKCTVLAINPGNLKDEEFINGVHIIRFKKASKYFYGFNPYFGKVLLNILRNNYDLIHIHGYHSLLSIEAAQICKIKNQKIVFSPHYHGVGRTKFLNFLFKCYRPIGKQVFNSGSKIICVSQHERCLLLNDFKIPKNKLEVVSNGVTHLEYTGKKKFNKNSLKLLYVGSFYEYKGLKYIFELVHELKNRCDKDIILDLIGTGKEEKTLKNLAAKLNITDNIRWHHSVTENQLYQSYIDSDILLLLSRAEAYGLVVAESLALGTPCIVSNITALQEFLEEPGCFGISYPPSIQELTELVMKIRESDINIGPFNKKIRLWDDVSKDYEKIYRDLCKNGDT